MGRRRTIDRDSMMDAVESVVRKHGLDGLSIDAVAREAGCSKSSVLYDFKNKNALLAAFIRNRVATRQAQLSECRAECRGYAPLLGALIEVMQDKPSEDEVSIAMIIAAGMREAEDCRAHIQQAISDDIAQVLDQSSCTRSGLLAYLALQGLMSLEYLDFHHLPDPLRSQALKDIAWLATGKIAAGAGSGPTDSDAPQPDCGAEVTPS